MLCHATAQRRGHLKRKRAASAPTLQPLHHVGDVPGRASVMPGRCHPVPGRDSGSDLRSAEERVRKEGHLLGKKTPKYILCALFCPLKLCL